MKRLNMLVSIMSNAGPVEEIPFFYSTGAILSQPLMKKDVCHLVKDNILYFPCFQGCCTVFLIAKWNCRARTRGFYCNSIESAFQHPQDRALQSLRALDSSSEIALHLIWTIRLFSFLPHRVLVHAPRLTCHLLSPFPKPLSSLVRAHDPCERRADCWKGR